MLLLQFTNFLVTYTTDPVYGFFGNDWFRTLNQEEY